MSGVLLDEQLARVRSLMQSGEFSSEAAVVDAALELLERRRRLRELVQEGVDAAERGEILDHDTVFREARRRIAEIAEEQSQKATAK